MMLSLVEGIYILIYKINFYCKIFWDKYALFYNSRKVHRGDC